jgi:hypothetical protein
MPKSTIRIEITDASTGRLMLMELMFMPWAPLQ